MAEDDPAKTLLWYWGRRNRNEIENLLRNTEDGTFLLFREGRSQDYTVALRVDGRTDYFIVLYRDGLFGLAEPLQFDDIETLLSAYTESPTAIGKLKYSYICPGDTERETNMADIPTNDIRGLLLHLKQHSEQKSRAADMHHQISQECRQIEESISALKTTQEGLEMTEKMLETHMKQQQDTAGKLHSSVQDKYSQVMSDNYEALMSRFSAVLKRNDEINREVAAHQVRRSQLLGKLTAKKTEVRDIDQAMNVIISKLERLGLKTEFIDGFLTEERDPTLPHYVTNSWLITEGQTIDIRPKDTPEGTFLVRPTRKASRSYIVDVVFEGRLKSFPVQQVDGRYGFDETTCVFATIQELVLMYSKTPFRVHDKQYGTLTLKTPINAKTKLYSRSRDIQN